MCGITGWVDWEDDLTQHTGTLSKMVATLAERGPDASGVYVRQHAAIGHRRLSVVDLENGAQPMIKAGGGGNFVITYNGELYNTPELRQELIAAGHVFTTHSDTEVLLTAYIEWGSECVQRFNGIFAFGIWDENRQSLFLARDRIGVKPLFYAERGSSFLFASELKALLANPLVKPEVDAEGLAEVLMIGPARTPGHGIFRDVYELKPGQCLMLTQTGKRIWRYWQLISQPHGDSFEITKQTVRELLFDAVQRQLVADVPVCTLLSGGLDSSALTAIAALTYQKEKQEPVSTYSVDYVDNSLYFKANSFQPNADAPWVEKVSRYFHTDHHSVLLDTPELVGVLPQATIARDHPGMADVDTSLYLFCREIKKGATVALSGECADEVFGGYPWFHRPDMLQADTFPWSPHPEIRVPWLLPEIQAYIRPEEYVRQRYQDALAEVPRLPGEDAQTNRMREIYYLSLTRFMPTLLDRKDRMSMAFGLEVRVPFCDHRIVDYVWNVPWQMKRHGNYEKGLLREAMTGVLPDDILWRRKSPYPKTHNPSFLNTVRSRALALLDDPDSPLRLLINKTKIREIAGSEKASSNIPWFGQLMSGAQLFAYLIQLDTWLRHYQVELV